MNDMNGTRRTVIGIGLLCAALFVVSGCDSHSVGASSRSRNTTSNHGSSTGDAAPSSVTTAKPSAATIILQLKALEQSGKVDNSPFIAGQSNISQVKQSWSSSSKIPIRGIIEGFYGTPWSDQERIDMFQFMQKENLNTYVYAPKGDPYQRVNWRLPYPAVQLAQLRTLVTLSQQDGVRL